MLVSHILPAKQDFTWMRLKPKSSGVSASDWSTSWPYHFGGLQPPCRSGTVFVGCHWRASQQASLRRIVLPFFSQTGTEQTGIHHKYRLTAYSLYVGVSVGLQTEDSKLTYTQTTAITDLCLLVGEERYTPESRSCYSIIIRA